MKRSAILLVITLSALFAGAQSNTPGDNTAQTNKQNTNEKQELFLKKYHIYDSLATVYEGLYRDSARQYLDSLFLIDRSSSGTEPVKEEKTGGNLRFRLYTDLVGLDSDQPNSLIQNQFFLSWHLNERPGTTGKGSSKKITLFYNLIFPIVDLWKVKSEDSLRYKLVDYDTVHTVKDITGKDADSVLGPIRHIHTLDLIRHARMDVSGKLNVLKLDCNKRMYIFLDVFGAVYRTGLRDTLLREEDSRFNVTSVGFGYNLKLRLKSPGSPFSLDVSYTSFGLRLLNNHVYQRYGSLYYPGSDIRNSVYDIAQAQKHSALQGIGIYGAEVHYSGKDNDKDDNELFLKMTLYTNPLLGDNATYNYNNNYFQVQLGTNQSIDKLWNLFKPSK